MHQPDDDRRDFDLLVLGDINPDIVVADPDLQPAFGQHERLVERIVLTPGGSGALVAAAAARLGLRVALIGVVGDDRLGDFMLARLAEQGVDVTHVRTASQESTGATVILARGLDRAVLTATGAIADLRIEDVPAELVRRARHLHVGSYYLQPGLHAGLPDLLRQARLAGTTTSVDPNWDPSERWDAGLISLLSEADLLMPNEAEALHIAERATLDEAIRVLLDRGSEGMVLAVKRGAHGAVGASRSAGRMEVPSLPVTALDTIGAGDAFDAGFITARLEGAGLGDALAFAVTCGALSTRALGGSTSQPTRAEVDAARASVPND